MRIDALGISARLRRIRARLAAGGPPIDVIDRAAWQHQRVAQVALLHQYRAWAAAGYVPSILDVGFSVNSQNDEDGVLLYTFAHAGFKSRVAVEIAAGDGIECNAANLLLHHGFTGLLFEGHPEKRAAGEEFYAKHPATSYFPPRFVGGWVTRENVNELVAAHMPTGVLAGGGEIDLLSLDIDGNDYWILDALHCVRPRVVIVEFNALWGATRAVTIPYAADFVAEPGPIAYLGASLPAFVKLLGKRGYRLVGVERLGFNAVFVRNDLAPALLEVSAEVCLRWPDCRHLPGAARSGTRRVAANHRRGVRRTAGLERGRVLQRSPS